MPAVSSKITVSDTRSTSAGAWIVVSTDQIRSSALTSMGAARASAESISKMTVVTPFPTPGIITCTTTKLVAFPRSKGVTFPGTACLAANQGCIQVSRTKTRDKLTYRSRSTGAIRVTSQRLISTSQLTLLVSISPGRAMPILRPHRLTPASPAIATNPAGVPTRPGATMMNVARGVARGTTRSPAGRANPCAGARGVKSSDPRPILTRGVTAAASRYANAITRTTKTDGATMIVISGIARRAKIRERRGGVRDIRTTETNRLAPSRKDSSVSHSPKRISKTNTGGR